MKNQLSAVLLALAAIFIISSCNSSNTETKLSKRDRIDLAFQQEYEMTKDANGQIPRGELVKALEQMSALNKTTAALPNINWTSLGPINQAGRSKTMLVDANDASGNTVFCGSVGGGIWRTTNINSTSPNWIPVNDFMNNLSVTSIGQDPANANILYAATGEPYGSSSSIRGLGVFKSTDGGITWNALPSTAGTDFYQCAKLTIAANSNVYVATPNGIFRSTNAGTSFTKILSASSPGASSNRGHDIKQAANGDLYASLDGSLHKSTDNGATWSAVSIGFNTGRIEIACAASSAQTLYLLTEDNNETDRIVRSTDGGTSWVTMTKPNDIDPGIPANDFSRGQAWYDLCIAVDPNDANTLFVGGIDLFKTTNGGASWTQISHWYGGFGHQEVHADQHFILFPTGSSSVVYFCTDGGIYSTANGTASVPTIASKGRNMVTLQLYGCDIHPTNPYYLGGAQDNGSHQYTSNAGLQSTNEVTGGDGAFCNIDQDQPQYQFTQYVYNEYHRSTNGGTTFNSITLSSSQGRFINPTDYDDANNIMYAARGNGRYLRWNNPQTGTNDDNVNAGFSGKVSAVKVSPNVNHQVYFGDDDGRVYRVSQANTNSPNVNSISTGLPTNKYVSCIEVEDGNENHLLVTYSNYSTNSVWESTNGGTSWTSVEGNLPNMPVRWAQFNPNNATQAFLATELGVWSTDNLNGNNTNWGATNNGLANVRVDMLKLNANKEMIASTHGRGMFYTNSLNSPINIPVTSITVIGQGNVSVINTMGGSLQMIENVLPINATNPAVVWSVANGTGSAAISPTGLLTAITDGTVTVTATSTDGTNVSGSTIITISNQVPSQVDSIDVYGQGRIFVITTPSGQLQMVADIYPMSASSQNVIWNMLPGGTGAASLTVNGLMTALANGTVIVEASATDGSGIKGSALITISNQFTLGNSDLKLDDIKFYPNPSNGIVKINGLDKVASISLMNLSGQMVKQVSLAESISLASLPKGNYVASIRLKDGRQRSQLISLR